MQQGCFAMSSDADCLCVEAALDPGLCQAVSRASRAGHRCSYLSVRVLPGPNGTLDVTYVRGWPSHKGRSRVNDGLAATTARNLLPVHDDAGSREGKTDKRGAAKPDESS